MCGWFVWVVGAGEGELPFMDGRGGEVIQIDVLIPVRVHHWLIVKFKEYQFICSYYIIYKDIQKCSN